MQRAARNTRRCQKVAELLEESPRLQYPESCAPGGEGGGGGWAEERTFSLTPAPRKLALRLEKLFSVFYVFAPVARTRKNEPTRRLPDSAIAVAPGFLEKPNFAFTTSKPISVLFLSLAD